MPEDIQKLEQLAKLIRYYILTSTTIAGSGHPTSSLSATDILNVLCFGGFFNFDTKNPDNPHNDRLIFSKGHAAPLFYALWAGAGIIKESELNTLRQFKSKLEGHPTMEFAFTEAATGSLGQGLSVGAGMAINAKYLDKLPYKTFVLLGDSEMAEGSVWEAMQIAAYYKLDNLIGIIDVNRLGQRGQTMYGHNLNAYKERAKAFGWEPIVIDGHDIDEITAAFNKTGKIKDKPTMIIAKTLKGKGVSFLEDKEGWHGKALAEDELSKALEEIGEVDKSLRGKIGQPRKLKIKNYKFNKNYKLQTTNYKPGQMLATRKAYGKALVKVGAKNEQIVVLDAETSNSTFAATFKEAFPDRFFEMFIAEQNMVGVALGLCRRGKIPFISTFAAFFARAFDQIRMSQYSNPNIKYVGSHAGVSIGVDGASQMGLEDIAMFRTLLHSVVLYPSDAVSCEKLVEEAAGHIGNVYIRTTRADTPILYQSDEKFPIGGSKVLKSSKDDAVTIVGAGITLHQAIKAHHQLSKQGISVRVIDLYSIKPLDIKTLKIAAKETGAIITVEDHFKEGGLGEAVATALCLVDISVHSLAVEKMPRSGQPEELLRYEGIDARAIVKKVKAVLRNS